MCNGLSASYFRRRAEEGNLLNYFCSVFALGERKKSHVPSRTKGTLSAVLFLVCSSQRVPRMRFASMDGERSSMDFHEKKWKLRNVEFGDDECAQIPNGA